MGICFFPFLQSKPDSSEIGSPKTTDDIVQEKGEEGRAARRRHKTENVKQQWSQEKAMAVELEQAQRWGRTERLGLGLGLLMNTKATQI